MNAVLNKLQKVFGIVGLIDRIENLSDGLETSNKEVKAQFSLGEMQKLRLARALLRNPCLLILNEVFSNIDSNQTTSIFTRLKKIYPKMSIIFVEHHVNSLTTGKIVCINGVSLEG